MLRWLRTRFEAAYGRLLRRRLDRTPDHVAVIQDGNRRYARENGADATEGHRAGAETTERILEWCADLDIEELTLYAFSTENFERPPDEREHIFDLVAEKLREFADAERVHDQRVRIRTIGDTNRLPERVREAVDYAEGRTRGYEGFTLNVALAYGGRNELLGAAREIAAAVDRGELSPDEIDVGTVEDCLYEEPVRDVDLIVRTGGDERTSNFLPWHANGNEAAVFFCAPYWPAFSKTDFLRGLRTYQAREESWQRARVERALALLGAFGGVELEEARSVVGRVTDSLPARSADGADSEPDPVDPGPAD